MNKKIFIICSIALVLVVSYFLFIRNKKVTNYPSKGTDVVAFGDSLVWGVGASSGKSFVSLLSQKTGVPIVNLGVPGNTTEDGLKRLSEIDKYNPKIVLLLLGGNDFLRNVPTSQIFLNLGKIIENLQGRGAVVVLLGIRGGIISDKFDKHFEDLAEKYHTAYVSNVLSGLLGNSKYMSDSVHPNDLGYEKIAERIYPVLSKYLKDK